MVFFLQTLTLTITDMELYCATDFVVVYEGSSSTDYITQYTLCGNNYPLVLITNTSVFYIHLNVVNSTYEQRLQFTWLVKGKIAN